MSFLPILTLVSLSLSGCTAAFKNELEVNDYIIFRTGSGLFSVKTDGTEGREFEAITGASTFYAVTYDTDRHQVVGLTSTRALWVADFNEGVFEEVGETLSTRPIGQWPHGLGYPPIPRHGRNADR